MAYPSPDRRVERLGAEPGPIPRPALLGDQPRVLISGAGPAPPWVDQMLLDAFPGAAVARRAGDPASAIFWGTPKAVEVVVRPDDIGALASEIRSSWPAEPCS